MENCKNCGVTFLGEEIPQGLLKGNPEYYKTLEQAISHAYDYGWTKDNKLKFKINMVVVKSDTEGKYTRCKVCSSIQEDL